MAAEDREVLWFARVEVGIGGPGLLGNNELLNEIGYGRVKLWTTIDAAWMFERWVGVGLFAGFNRRSSDVGSAQLNAWSGFGGAEVPFLVWGERSYALHLTPRGGFAVGTVSGGSDATARATGLFGAAASFQSFTYHVGASLGWLMAPGRAGDIGPAHDFGGIYAALGGTIDG